MREYQSTEPHEMGLQIPRGVHPEAAQEVDLRGAAQAPRDTAAFRRLTG